MSDPGSDGIRRVSSELEALPFETRRFVSVYAYVLSRVARIDPGVTDAERDFMERAVSEVGGLTEGQAALVVQVAHSLGALFGATEDYVVTREFASLATIAQCEALLRTAFAVSAADGFVSESELSELREIGVELGMEPSSVEAITAELIERLDPEPAPGDR